ncbi:ABC transporter substrate-binding protein [Bradyrhizobium sp. AUGA SZCCT0431]|nr:ABC transporter substrate-binding protein [Bradyrhizobium sp. AUGA SZCCT0431]
MKRRKFLGILGGAVALPIMARAQPAIPVIGYLGAESAARFASRLEAFRRGLRSTGFDEGRNVTIEYRWAEGRNDRLPALAAELVSRQVSVIVAPGSVPSALAAKAATRTIPIVFEIGADPVAAGLVAGLSRPEDNVTGVTSLNWAIAAKRLQLLHEVAPTAGSFAVLVNPSNPKNAEAVVADLRTAARTLGCDLHVLHASKESDFGEAFSAFGKLGAGGLVIANDASFVTRSEQLAALTLRDRVAAVHQSREFAAAGGLMSYGGSVAESHGQAGAYVGRILKGQKVAELPVVQVTKVEMVVNLKTAKALGLTMPLSLLGRADEVIE